MTPLLMPSPQRATSKKTRSRKLSLLFERVMAIIALIDFGFVLFDLSYIPGRDLYFQYLPSLTKIYDPIKGIEPHRETQKYLDAVGAIETQITRTGLGSPEVKILLQKQQDLSAEMIAQNPFALANKTGILEKIKYRMVQQYPNSDKSAKKAFRYFWSLEHLNDNNWKSEMNWFQKNISSLIELNYFRRLSLSGDFVNRFWRIDLIFIGIFAVEFLARTFIISRRNQGVSWSLAMLWRWYDWFLLIPLWQELRIISIIARVDQAKMPDLEPIRKQINRFFVASLAQELTEVVILQIFNQMQEMIKDPETIKQIFSNQQRRYIDINGVNEIDAIATRLVQITVYKVLPQLQPDIEALLRHSLESNLKQSSLYKNLQQIPGLEDFSHQVIQQLIQELSKLASEGPQNAYETIQNAMNDPVGTQLSNQLVQHFGEILGKELQQKQTVQEIQLLLCDFIEEMKINYIQRSKEEDMEKILAQSQELRQIAIQDPSHRPPIS
jgi:hypothetical protein